MQEPDFSGYASKNDLMCSDGRTIKAGAFKHYDQKRVPLVWQHQHGDPDKVLGHAILENRADGVYARGFFNKTPQGDNAKILVQHGDVTSMSIYANNLKQQGGFVLHGDIREVSLVLAGANPGAVIENVNLMHGDGMIDTLDDEAIIHTGLDFDTLEEEPEIEHANTNQGGTVATATASTDEKTIKEVFDAMTPEQQAVVHYLVGAAAESEEDKLEQSAFIEGLGEAISHSIEEGFTGMRNAFESNAPVVGGTTTEKDRRKVLSHSQIQDIVKDADRLGSFKESFLAHATEYGIEDIDFLFPDARTLSNQPEMLARRMEWVTDVLTKTKHSPFSRIKTIVADITADEARARGYVKGNLKKDEIIKLLRRVTTPKTIYKKQKLDRDDIIDIVDIDVVAWLKAEMRLMLDEELARAILIGDGREPDDPDKIDEDHIRPIAFDEDMYTHVVTLDGTPTASEQIEAIVRARRYYKGTGTPSYYTTDENLTDLLLDKDTLGRRFYNTEAELAAALRVKDIIVVEVMESTPEVVGILVNLTDYTVGADKGGAVSMFEDFDIDFNQEKYLIETRVSGALTKPKSAIVIKRNPGNVVTPTAPTFVASTGVVTIPAVTGVVYKNQETDTTLSAGAQTAIAAGATIDIVAVPSTGYSFPHGFDADWTFTRDSA